MRKFCLFLLIGLFFASAVYAGTYLGLEPGVSTKTDAERVLGKPTKEVKKDQSYEYAPEKHDASKLLVIFNPASGVMEAITIYFKKPYTKTQLNEWFDLGLPDETKITTSGKLVEFYITKSISLKYLGADESSAVEALSHYNPVTVKAQPKTPGKTANGLAVGFCKEGDKFLDQKQYDMAISLYKKAIELEPKEPFFYAELGTAYRLKGDRQNAIPAFKKSVALKPDYYPYLSLGDIYWELKNYDQAIANLEQATALWNTSIPDASAFSILGHCYYQKKKLAQARDTFTRAYQLNPGDPVNIYFLAACHDGLNSKKEAREFYTRFLQMHNTDAQMNAKAKERLSVLSRKN